MNDALLTAMLKKHSKNSIEMLIRKYSSYVGTIVYNTIGGYASKEDIEEVVQDVFIAIWNHADSIHNLKGYVATTARNTALNKLREIEVADELEGNERDGGQSPHEALEGKEMTRILYEEIEALGEPDSEIFIRYYYNDEKIRDIATETGLNMSTIKSKLKRGKEKLKERLSERGDLL